MTGPDQTNQAIIDLDMMVEIHMVNEQRGLADQQQRCKQPLIQTVWDRFNHA